MIKFRLPLKLYEEFNELLEAAIRRKLGSSAEDLSGAALWNVARENQEISQILFKGGWSNSYFLKKLDKIKERAKYIPLDRKMFCHALELFGYPIPPHEDQKQNHYEIKIREWAPKYISDNYPENPEYISYFLSADELNHDAWLSEIEKRNTGHALINKSRPALPEPCQDYQRVFSNLAVQGERSDAIVLYFDYVGSSQITGEFHVLYLDELGNYPQLPEILELTGYLSNNHILTLAGQNKDPDNKHYCAVMLELNSAGDLSGNYIVYHNPIPEARMGIPGHIPHTSINPFELFKATMQESRDFLERIRGGLEAPLRVSFSKKLSAEK